MAQESNSHAAAPDVPAAPAASNDVRTTAQTTAANIEGHLGILTASMKNNTDSMIENFHKQSVRMVRALTNHFQDEKNETATAAKYKITQVEVERDGLKNLSEALEKQNKTLKAVNEKLEQEKEALALVNGTLQEQKALLESHVAELEIKFAQSQAEYSNTHSGQHHLDAMQSALVDSSHADQPGDAATATNDPSYPNKKRKITPITPITEDDRVSDSAREAHSDPADILKTNANPSITPNITLKTKTPPIKSPYFPAPKHPQGTFLLQVYRLKVNKSGYTKLGEKNLQTKDITTKASLVERVQAMMQSKKLKNSSEDMVYAYRVEDLEVLGEVELLPALSSDTVIESWLRRVGERSRERKPLVRLFVYGKEDEVEAEELMKVHD